MSDDLIQQPERKHGRRGVRESHAPEALKLRNLRVTDGTAPVRAPLPASADVGGGISNWGMLGNGPDPDNLPCYPNGAGCCGESMWGHKRMASAVKQDENGKPIFDAGFRAPHTQYTQNLYVAYQRAQGATGDCPDNGTDNFSFFTWLYQESKSNPDFDELAFAEIDLVQEGVAPADAIHQAMIDFRGACVAVCLNNEAEQQFERDEPWSISETDPIEQNEGHDIFLGAFGAPPKGLESQYNNAGASDWFVSWGAWQGATVAWDSAAITDAWVVMTREDAEAAGYDFDAAVTAIEAMIHGEGPTSQTPQAPESLANVSDGTETPADVVEDGEQGFVRGSEEAVRYLKTWIDGEVAKAPELKHEIERLVAKSLSESIPQILAKVTEHLAIAAIPEIL